MTITELDTLLSVRSEGEHVEFKEAKNNFHFGAGMMRRV
jgi:hypothetical protein